ncbi:MAG: DUF4136 domain-containing protein, partial [Pseudomonadales bacterium]
MVALTVTLGGCASSGMAPESECLAPSRVDSWKTIAWFGAPAATGTMLDARTESALEAALVEAAQRVGLRLASPTEADLIMAYRLATAQYVDPRLAAGQSWGCWGRKAPDPAPRSYTEATLLVEMTERSSGEVVWRSRVQHTLTEEDRL